MHIDIQQTTTLIAYINITGKLFQSLIVLGKRNTDKS